MRKAKAIVTYVVALTLTVVAVGFAGFASAQGACDFLELDVVENQSVEQGVVAVYPVTVRNTGSDAQTIGLSAKCNPASTGLACDFSDVPYPNTLGAGEARVYRLNVDTSKAASGSYLLGLRVSGGVIPGSCATHGEVALVVLEKPPSAVVTLKVAASLTAENTTARPGETAEWIVLLRNNRDDAAYVALSATENPFSKNIGFDAVEVRLSPGEQRAIRAKVVLPAGTPGGVYDWLFVARVSTFEGIANIEMPARLRVVGPTIAVQLIGEPLPEECLEVKHRGTSQFEMKVKNAGEAKVVLSFYVEAGKETAKSILIKPGLLELLPGEVSSIVITVAPPSTAVVDTYYYVFVAEHNGFQLLKRPYCFSVKGLEEVVVAAPKSVEVLRTIPKEFSFVVKNTGTVSDNYSLEFTPLLGVETVLSPMNFVLFPGDSQAVKTVLKTTMATKLREEPLSITLRSKAANISKGVAINVSIVSSNQSNASLLAIDSKNFSVVEGVPSSVEVIAVKNLDVEAIESVSFAVNGIPSAWYSTAPAQQDIPALSSASFELVFNASVAGTFNVLLTAFAGREGVAVPSVLRVEEAAPGIDARVFATQPVEQEGVVKSVVVNLSVRNTGNTPLTDVEPGFAAFTGDFAFSTARTSLAPGETKTVFMVVRPLAESTPSREVPVQAVALEASSTPQTIVLPAMAREKYAAGVSLTTVAAVIVLAALLSVLVFLAWRARQAEY